MRTSAVAPGPRPVPASIGQRLLWLLEQFRGADGAANCPILLRLRGPLDVDCLRTGLDVLAARHEALRTTFSGRGRRLVQVIHPPRSVALRHVDLSGGTDLDRTLHEAVLHEIRRPIDASSWPVRSTLWRLGIGDHALCINMHHLVTDGWSCGLILRDLVALTGPQAAASGLPAVGWQYRDFCTWQQEWLRSEESRHHREYWRRQLHAVRLPEIPLETRSLEGARLANGSLGADIATDLVQALQGKARALRTTLPAVMLAAYYVVLSRATGQQDLAVASFLSNRTRPEMSDTVGLLANMVVLRADLRRSRRFHDVVRAAHLTVMDALVHQGIPYQLLPADTIGQRHRRPDDVVFQMVPHAPGRHIIAGAEAEAILVEALGTRFECELQICPTAAGLRAVLFFNRSRLGDARATDLLAEFVAVLSAAGSGPGPRPLGLS